MKVCLVHDFLNQLGGAERTLAALHELWPRAPIYTLVADWKIVDQLNLPRELIHPLLKNWKRGWLKYLTLFFPFLWENLSLEDFEIIISSSASFAKGVITHKEQIHLNYCHTPPRFLYHLPAETTKRQHWPWKGFLAVADFFLRNWDFVAAWRPDFLIANSYCVAERIKKFYRRRALVIYPPVELVEKAAGLEFSPPGDYYLVVSRLSAYKNIPLVIEACSQLNLNLKIVGVGPEKRKWERLAQSKKAKIQFCGFVEDEKLLELYRQCRGLIFPVLEEDFGIVPVEAMALGRPVVALASGGVKESVVHERTGLLFSSPTLPPLLEALQKLEQDPYFQSRDCFKACRQQAQRFSKTRFQKKFYTYVKRLYQKKFTRD